MHYDLSSSPGLRAGIKPSTSSMAPRVATWTKSVCSCAGKEGKTYWILANPYIHVHVHNTSIYMYVRIIMTLYNSSSTEEH